MEDSVAIGCNGDSEGHITLDVGNTDNVECQGSVIWREDDIKQAGSQTGVVLTSIQGGGRNIVLGRSARGKREEGDQKDQWREQCRSLHDGECVSVCRCERSGYLLSSQCFPSYLSRKHGTIL